MPKLPPVRETETTISIDQKKGEWPFMQAIWGQDDHGKRKLLIAVDSNEGGAVVGEGKGIGAIVVSQKKAEALRDFLDRTL